MSDYVSQLEAETQMTNEVMGLPTARERKDAMRGAMVQADSGASHSGLRSPTQESEFKFGTWYDISTAPKDGTPLLCWDGFEMQVVYSHKFDFATGRHAWFNGYAYVKPTQWMPQPPPPSNGDRKPEDPCSADSLKQTSPPSPISKGEE